MISDAMDDMNDDDEEEEDEIVGQILDEIGIFFSKYLGLKQNNEIEIKNDKIKEKIDDDDDLLSKRLESLKKEN
jgi:division protein CdvB (Snf7/Vps24/ESCRT-III family)